MTSWWNLNLSSKRMDDFKSWIKDYNQEDRKYTRQYIISKNYRTFLDCGSGLATEYYGFAYDKYNIDYTGLDSCKHLIDMHRNNNIKMIDAEMELSFPIADNIYDVVYCRAVLEHLSSYKNAINELIRTAIKEVLIVWFIVPDDESEHINYWIEEDLYHNKYNKAEVEKHILSNPKVQSIEWKKINDEYTVMHILLK